MTAEWRFIQPSGVNEADGGPWLARCSTTATSYVVECTNLVHIWSETLERREIYRRALNDETLIDPTEDASQLRLLLDTIIKPLTSQNGQAHLRTHGTDDNMLEIKTTVPLPSSRHKIEWTFSLERRAESAVGKEILIPSWLYSYRDQRKIKDLAKMLIEKDHVIDKLLESIRGNNIELSSVFPSTAGLKASKSINQREQAGTVVPGLATFDKERWENEIEQISDDAENARPTIPFTDHNLSIFESVMRVGGKSIPSNGVDRPPLSSTHGFKRADATSIARSVEPADDEETEDEEDFETKEFPRSSPPGDASEDVDMIASSFPAPASTQPESFLVADSQPPIKRPSRLGAVGKRPTEKSPAPPHVADKDEDVRIDSSQPATLPARPARKLGAVGRPRQTHTRQTTEGRSSPMETSETNDRSGDLLAEADRLESERSSEPTAPTTKAVLEAPKKETMTEEEASEAKDASADRRREELKRSLQAQERAPARKKKRF